MEKNRRNFLLFLAVLLIFSAGTALFVKEEDMVYEPAGEVTEEIEDGEEDGDAQKVNAALTALSAGESEAAERDFFASFRLERERRRDREAELYQEILADSGRDETAREEAGNALSELYRRAGIEDEVEQILIGRHYGDALFIFEDTMSLLILEGEILSETEIADLSAFVSAYAGISEGSISVFTAE